MPFHVYVQGAVGQLGDLSCKDLRQHGCLSAVRGNAHFVKADHKTVIAVHEVEHADCEVSVFQNSCNHQRFLRSSIKREAVNLVIGAILIDCQRTCIGQNGFLQRFGRRAAQVTADHQRGRKQTPCREMRSLLGQCAAVRSALAVNEAVGVHAHNQHIHIVETAVPVIGKQSGLLLGNALNGLPAVMDIVGGTEKVRPRGFDPLLCFLHAP